MGDVAGDGRAGYVPGRHELLPGHHGLDLRRQREHDGDVHGRQTPGSRVVLDGRARHDGRAARRLGLQTRAWRTNASITDCARPASGGGTNAAGDDPAARCRHRSATFPDRAALKAAVDNCLAVDPTGVACCNHGADCGAAGTVEMPDWDVSQVTSMSELFQSRGSSTRIYRDGIPRASRTCTRCSEMPMRHEWLHDPRECR